MMGRDEIMERELIELSRAQRTPPMTPERVIETGRQFGQKIGRKEAKTISAALLGWRGRKEDKGQ